jgi:hypothetical protein
MDRGARARGARRPRSMPWHLGGLVAACASGALLLTAPCAEADPVNTALPVISGVLDAGQTLTATPGSWTDSGATITSYWYQWMLCQGDCTAIDNANSSTYTITDADNGEQLEVGVIAYDSAGNFTSVLSNATFVVGSGYTFNGPSYTLSESTVGNGSVTGFATGMEAGRIADANLSCPGVCGASYSSVPGTEVELIATPATGSTFLGWGGACSGSAPTCSLTMSGDEAAVATFSGATTSLVLPLGHEDEAGEAPPPAVSAPSLGAWEPSATGLPARLLGIGYRRRHVQAEVECEEMGSCRLSLALFAGARTARVMIARRSFTIPHQRSARISLALDREGERILARRHRLPITARLVLSGAGRTSLVGQGRFTLTR